MFSAFSSSLGQLVDFVSEKMKKLWSTPFSTMLNSLPNETFLDWSVFKTFADDKLDVAEIFEFVLVGVETAVGKGENAGYLFPQCFQKASPFGSLKLRIV